VSDDKGSREQDEDGRCNEEHPQSSPRRLNGTRRRDGGRCHVHPFRHPPVRISGPGRPDPGLHSGCALGLVPALGDLLRFARGLSVFRTDVRRLGVREGVEGAHGNGRIKLPSQARSWVPDPPELLAVRMGGTTSAPAMFEESGRREWDPRSQLGKPRAVERFRPILWPSLLRLP
jgi:hypothetical protein